MNLLLKLTSGFVGRFGSPRVPRRSHSLQLLSESMESRSLLTANPLSLTCTYSDHTIAVGQIANTDGINEISVNVDVGNDGSIEQTLSVSYDSVLQKYLWEVETNGLGDPYEGFEVAFTATGVSGGVDPETGGGMQQVSGNKVVEFIQLSPSSPPTYVFADAMNGIIWGSITDDSLGINGEYTVEFSTTSESEGFAELGGVIDSEGNFVAISPWAANGEPITVWTRVRENTDGFTLYSNVIRIDIPAEDNGAPEMGAGGGVEEIVGAGSSGELGAGMPGSMGEADSGIDFLFGIIGTDGLLDDDDLLFAAA